MRPDQAFERAAKERPAQQADMTVHAEGNTEAPEPRMDSRALARLLHMYHEQEQTLSERLDEIARMLDLARRESF